MTRGNSLAPAVRRSPTRCGHPWTGNSVKPIEILQSRSICILKQLKGAIPVEVSSCKGNLPIKDSLSKACRITPKRYENLFNEGGVVVTYTIIAVQT
jgi:hypothetical protein